MVWKWKEVHNVINRFRIFQLILSPKSSRALKDQPHVIYSIWYVFYIRILVADPSPKMRIKNLLGSSFGSNVLSAHGTLWHTPPDSNSESHISPIVRQTDRQHLSAHSHYARSTIQAYFRFSRFYCGQESATIK